MVVSSVAHLSAQPKAFDDSALARQMSDSSIDSKQREAACKQLSSRYQNSVVAALTKRFGDPTLALESWNQSMIKFWNAEVNISNAGSVFNLIFTIAVNHGISQLRKINCRVPLNQGDTGIENIRANSESFISLEFADEKITKFREALSQLNPKQREIIEYVYLKGLKYKECAEKLQIPIGTVMSTIFKAKQIAENFKPENLKEKFLCSIIELLKHRPANMFGNLLWQQQFRSTEYMSRWIELKNSASTHKS